MWKNKKISKHLQGYMENFKATVQFLCKRIKKHNILDKFCRNIRFINVEIYERI